MAGGRTGSSSARDGQARNGPGAGQDAAGYARVRVRILGEEYVIRGQVPPDYIVRLAEIVDTRMRAIQQQHPQLVLHRVAILAAFHLADELERARRENADLLQLLEESR